jgi:hypothetical protein
MFDELLRVPAKGAEQDFRLSILNALMRTPHRELEPYMPLFRHVHDNDPLFFGPLAAWYHDNGSVHDLKQLFIAFMVSSDFSDEYRDAGLALLAKLPPYQVERVIGLVKGHKSGDKFVPGVAGSVPRSLKTAVEEYLREREKNRDAFDSVVLHARRSLKTLYASLRIKPGEYAQKVLFDNKPEPGSRLYVLKQLAEGSDPEAKALLIVQNKIPYRVAISAIKTMTPTIVVALVSVMTPQEVINNLASLKKRGCMDNADLRQLIESKLEEAKSDKRVSALKTRQALASANLDEDLVKKVEAVGDAQIKSKARIKRATALLVDKSGSMEQAIDVGKQIASIIAPVCDAGLYVYAFDSVAYSIKAKGTELSDWEKAFKGIKAAGNTSCGAPVEVMRKNIEKVEQIVIVTDQGDNTKPLMHEALLAYAKELGLCPSVMIVNVGNHNKYVETLLQQHNIEVNTFTFSGDYYSLPSLLPLLSGGTRLELLTSILNYPLPERKRKLAATAAT